ncbi:unnamed protein product, partial [Rotaria socialis]
TTQNRYENLTSYIPFDVSQRALQYCIKMKSIQENFFIRRGPLIKIGNLIVKRLSSLQVIKLESVNVKLIEMSHILINGLDKLSFLTIIGADHFGEIYDKSLRDLQNSNTRSFRTEAPKTIDEDTLFVWL